MFVFPFVFASLCFCICIFGVLEIVFAATWTASNRWHVELVDALPGQTARAVPIGIVRATFDCPDGS